MPPTTAGDEACGDPAPGPESIGSRARRRPLEARKAYRLRSSEATYTTPFATAGEDGTAPSVFDLQTWVPVAASNAYRPWSYEPTKTNPPATAGEDRIWSPVGAAHNRAPVNSSNA